MLALHDAPLDILTDARPHIGSNRLPKVVTAIRARLEEVGVQFRFESTVTDLITTHAGTRRKVTGLRLKSGEELGADAVVIATGHSARDVIGMLSDHGVQLESKPFAMGVRIEHPQPLINEIQYGRHSKHPKLPAASYRLAHQVEDRGVFSFCMCPGGWVVPASTCPAELVVNGMSLSRRDSPFANSGLVVGITPEDLSALGVDGPSAGIEAQRKLERTAFEAGGGEFRAPATRVTDFLEGRPSSSLPTTSYLPGLTPTDISGVLDTLTPTLSARLKTALRVFGKSLRGYVSEEAVLIGVESRNQQPRPSSSPSRAALIDGLGWALPMCRGSWLRRGDRQRSPRRHPGRSSGGRSPLGVAGDS